MTLHPDEQARELVHSDAWQDAEWPEGEAKLIAALLAHVRLAEAEWWAASGRNNLSWASVGREQQERIASLRQAVGEGK